MVCMQGTKAAALGPRRDMSRLGGVLAEPMLSAFTKEAAIAQESGWFWRYNLKSIKVLLSLHQTELKPPVSTKSL